MRYFPDSFSCWVFLGALAVVLAIAGYNDERYMKVPKWLTIPALVIGIILSLIRGALLASQGMPVWILGEQGVALGLLDGFLFSLAGFVVGFGLFFGLWIMGVCGGGDVKLFAALGTWLGPYLILLVLFLSLVLLSFCLVFIVALRLVRGKKLVQAAKSGASGPKRGPANLRSPIVVRFSLVAAVATLLVALWAFRTDLGFSRPGVTPYTAEVNTHGR